VILRIDRNIPKANALKPLARIAFSPFFQPARLATPEIQSLMVLQYENGKAPKRPRPVLISEFAAIEDKKTQRKI
jgi:hypothetical protein